MRTSANAMMMMMAVIILIAFVAQGGEKPHGMAAGSVAIAGMSFPEVEEAVAFEDLLAVPIMRPGDEALRERLAAGITKWVTVRDHRREKAVVWNECGERIKQEDVQENALEWADQLIRAANTSATLYGWRINLWGVMGTIANESCFDRCAIGGHTRKWAYKKGFLKAKRFTWISHTKEDIMKLVSQRQWKKKWKWVDAGALQVLWKRIYRGPLENMLTLNPGLDIGIQEMQRRSNGSLAYINPRSRKRLSKLYKRSWRLWPGQALEAARSIAYDTKITKFARRMGASRTEI